MNAKIICSLCFLFSCVFSCETSRSALLTSGHFDEIIRSMTIEEKVGQLFFSFFYGDRVTPEARVFFEESKLGNIIYYSWSNTLTSIHQVKRLSCEIQDVLQDTVGLPAFIGVDQEGGNVFRLRGEFTEFPGNRAIAATGNVDLAYEVAFAEGSEMKSVGITLDFAPVVDIQSNPNNPIIGIRSFSEDPAKVIQFARAMIRGFHDAGICVTLKHFPGHGDTDVDSHKGLPVLTKSRQEIESFECVPFQALHHETDAIMSAHMCVPAFDAEHPATFSHSIMTDLLRGTIGYSGLVISDSLVMKGAVPNQHTLEETIDGVSEAAISSFLAGADCCILGRLEWADFPDRLSVETNKQLTCQVLRRFAQAVREGKIPQNRLDESVRRVLVLKQKSVQNTSLKKMTSDHKELAQEVARSALTCVSPQELIKRTQSMLRGKRVLILAPESLREAVGYVQKEIPESILFTQEDLSIGPEAYLLAIRDRVAKADCVLFLSYRAHAMTHQSALLEQLSETLPCERLVIVGMGNSVDVIQERFITKHLVYLTYSPLGVSLMPLVQKIY